MVQCGDLLPVDRVVVLPRMLHHSRDMGAHRRTFLLLIEVPSKAEVGGLYRHISPVDLQSVDYPSFETLRTQLPPSGLVLSRCESSQLLGS